jgi:hypothetical protein
MKKNQVFVLILVLFVLSAGCTAAPMEAATTPTAILPSPVDYTLTRQAPLTPTITRTRWPTRTTTPTPTITPTFTATPETVLPKEVVVDTLFNWLEDNGGCRLPCLMGFDPRSQESIQSLYDFKHAVGPNREFLVYADQPYPQLSLNTYENENFWSVGVGKVLPDIEYGIGLSYDLDNFINQPLVLFSGRMSYVTEDNFNRIYIKERDALFRYFTLPQILSEYGPPENIGLFIDETHPIVTGAEKIELYVLYPTLGFSLRYTFPRIEEEDKYLICPNLFNRFMVMSFKPNSEMTEEYLFRMLEISYSYNFMSLEEGTGMTVDEFMTVFSQPTSTCIKTSKALWE